jgi:type I restriction enzyme S subunit
MPIPICSIEEQQQINAGVEAQLTAVARLDREIKICLSQAAVLRQSILKRAFSGQLVPQDASDEPVSILLERIRGSQGEGNTNQRRNNKKVHKEAA